MKVKIHWLGEQYRMSNSDYEWVVTHFGELLDVYRIDFDRNGLVNKLMVYQDKRHRHRDTVTLENRNYATVELFGTIPKGQVMLGRFDMHAPTSDAQGGT